MFYKYFTNATTRYCWIIFKTLDTLKMLLNINFPDQNYQSYVIIKHFIFRVVIVLRIQMSCVKNIFIWYIGKQELWVYYYVVYT